MVDILIPSSPEIDCPLKSNIPGRFTQISRIRTTDLLPQVGIP
jgi:hypothetical protein